MKSVILLDGFTLTRLKEVKVVREMKDGRLVIEADRDVYAQYRGFETYRELCEREGKDVQMRTAPNSDVGLFSLVPDERVVNGDAEFVQCQACGEQVVKATAHDFPPYGVLGHGCCWEGEEVS